MKKLLSNLTVRSLALLVPAALVAGFFAPSQALAEWKEMRIGSGSSDGSEGDPLDTNDYGGGGGFDEGHYQTGSTTIGSGGYPSIDFSRISVLLVPEFQGGTLIFRIIYLDNPASGLNSVSLEGNHAP